MSDKVKLIFNLVEMNLKCEYIANLNSYLSVIKSEILLSKKLDSSEYEVVNFNTKKTVEEKVPLKHIVPKFYNDLSFSTSSNKTLNLIIKRKEKKRDVVRKEKIDFQELIKPKKMKIIQRNVDESVNSIGFPFNFDKINPIKDGIGNINNNNLIFKNISFKSLNYKEKNNQNSSLHKPSVKKSINTRLKDEYINNHKFFSDKINNRLHNIDNIENSLENKQSDNMYSDNNEILNEQLSESDLLLNENDKLFHNKENEYDVKNINTIIETIETKVNNKNNYSEFNIKIENPEEIKKLNKLKNKRYQQCFKIKAINVPSKTDLIEKIEKYLKESRMRYENNNENIFIKDGDFIIEYFEESISFIFINKDKAVEFYKFLQKVKSKAIIDYYKMEIFIVFGLEARESIYKLNENVKNDKLIGNSSLAVRINDKREIKENKLRKINENSAEKKLNNEKFAKLSNLMITEIPNNEDKLFNKDLNEKSLIKSDDSKEKKIENSKISSYKNYFKNSQNLVNKHNSTNYNMKYPYYTSNERYNSNNSFVSKSNLNKSKNTNNSFKENNNTNDIVCRKTLAKNYVDESIEKFYQRSLKRISDKKYHKFNEKDIKSNHINNINFSLNEKKNFAIKQSKIYGKQQEILDKINPSFNSISSPYMNIIELERINEINHKEKFIDKQGFNLSLTKNYLGKIIKPLDNYVNLTPSEPPVLHKFRSTQKNLWMSSEGFKP